MLENNLRTTSVTRTVRQDEGQQLFDQRVRFQAGAQHVTEGSTQIEQTGEQSAKVLTENIGTPQTDYVRYGEIDTNQTNQAGQELDFSNVIGVWGRSPAGEPGQTTGEQYNEIALGAVPFGNLSASQRHDLIRFIIDNNVYEVDYGQVRRGSDGLRPEYTYQVTIQPQQYIALLKAYGEVAGLTQLRDVDPAAYQNSQPLRAEMTVDVWSQRLRRVTFENGREEAYSAYGLNRTVELPTEAVPVQELENRINNIQ